MLYGHYDDVDVYVGAYVTVGDEDDYAIVGEADDNNDDDDDEDNADDNVADKYETDDDAA